MEGLLNWLRAEWDRVAGVGCISLGAVIVILGYRGVSRSPYIAEELAYVISGGIGGLVFIGLGATLLISADLHDEWRKLDRLEDALNRIEAAVRESGVSSNGSGPQADAPAPPRRRGRARAATVDDAGVSVASAIAPAEALIASRYSLAGIGAAAQPIDLRQLPNAMLTAAGSALIAVIVVVVGWSRAAGTSDASPALRGTATAIAGLVLAVASFGGFVLWFRRRVGQREAQVVAPIVLHEIANLVAADPTAAEQGTVGGGGKVLVAEGGSRYCLPACPVIAAASAVTELDASEVAELQPCGICHG